MKIAIAGNQGSFSHEAGLFYRTAQQQMDCEFVFSTDSEGVFTSLEQDQADLGIMPISNPTAGLVEMTLAAMGRHLFTVEASFTMPVVQCLLTLSTIRPDVIKTMVSHEQALRQCQRYLDTHWPECRLQTSADTAQAAGDLATGRLPIDSAVIASKMCAELYGLRLVAEQIQDDKENKTTFVVVKK